MLKKNLILGFLIMLAMVCFLAKDILLEKVGDVIFGEYQYKEEVLTITLNEPASDLSPYALNLNNLIRTANIYEGLVGFDKNLRITPALAVSWGNINPTTWEFKLRKNVLFHDRSNFTADSVVSSFKSAQSEGSGQIGAYINTIEEIKVIDENNIQIITKNPDPLLLSKLTKIFISRPGNMGTGSYKIREWISGTKLGLIVFTDYWGKQPVFKDVEYVVTQSKSQRKISFKNEETDLLVAVPQDQALELPKNQIKTNYSMEVNFLMFNMNDELIQKREIRDAIRTLFDPIKIETIGNNFIRQATQFIAPGVYGYNAEIAPFEFDEEEMAENFFGEGRFEKVSFDHLSSYRTLSEYIVKQLRTGGFSVKDNSLPPAELLDRIQNNKSDIFLIGWQAEDGDAGGFLNTFIHSDGEFNNGRFKNAEIDSMIEESMQEMDPQKRLALLKDVIKKLDDELIGIPLFESSRLYAVQPYIKWEPRLDGLVLATEVK